MQALDLNRRNVDAWVARGAAYANQHAFPRAISDLQTALGQPGMTFNLYIGWSGDMHHPGPIAYEGPIIHCWSCLLQAMALSLW